MKFVPCNGLTCVHVLMTAWGQTVNPREGTNFHPFLQRANCQAVLVKLTCQLLIQRFIIHAGLSYQNHSHESKSKNLATSALILSLDAEKHTFIAAGQLWPLVIILNDLGGRELELEIHRPASPNSSTTHHPQMHSRARIHACEDGTEGMPY